MQKNSLEVLVTDELSNMKALNVKTVDVKELTTITDTMIIASGTSDRHTQSIARHIIDKAKAQGFTPVGVEGQQTGEWILVDLGDVVVHIMLPRIRDFYNLEKLWCFNDTEALSA